MLGLRPFDKLVSELSRLPGVGQKTAVRLAYFILKSNKTYAESLAGSLLHVKQSIKTCLECFNYTEEDQCSICKDPRRQQNMMCIVEEPMDIIRLEEAKIFHGLYHVLHGVISPLEGIRPEDLRIRELVSRVRRIAKKEKDLEIIFAFDSDLEGDTTLLYLTKILSSLKQPEQSEEPEPFGKSESEPESSRESESEPSRESKSESKPEPFGKSPYDTCSFKMSRLAHGMPMGADMDYIDERTLAKALENRLEMKIESQVEIRAET